MEQIAYLDKQLDTTSIKSLLIVCLVSAKIVLLHEKLSSQAHFINLGVSCTCNKIETALQGY